VQVHLGGKRVIRQVDSEYPTSGWCVLPAQYVNTRRLRALSDRAVLCLQIMPGVSLPSGQ